MKKRDILFAITVALLSITTYSQNTVKNIDSLLQVLETSRVDTVKSLAYRKIASHYNVTSLDSAKFFAVKGVEYSKKIDFKEGLWQNYSTLGNYYERKTAYDSAMVYYNKALDIVKDLNDTKGFAVILNNIALIDTRKGDYVKALEGYFQALKAEESIGDKNGIAQSYNNIGVVYYYTKNFDKTTEYLTKGLEMQEQLGNLDGLQNGYNNVAAIYDYQQKYDGAINSYKKALDISRRLKDKKQEASFLSNIALSYSKKKDFKTAEDYFKQSEALRISVKDYNGLANSYINYGKMLFDNNKTTEARKYANQGLDLSKKYGIKLMLKEGYALLTEIAEKENNYKEANTYLYDYIAIKDSILNETNSRIIEETEAKYETEKKERDLAETRADLAESELKVRQKNNLIYGSLGLALILGLLGYLFYNQQKLKNRQLQKEAELKEALVKIETQNKLQEQRLRISRDLHDNIGAQLTFIISSIDNLKYGLKEATKTTRDKLSSISDFTSQTIYELRDTIWAMNKEDITFEDLQVRISNFIDKAKVASEKTQFSFSIDSAINPEHSFSSVVGMNIYRIIQEAVNNSLKYADASEIKVSIKKEASHFTITVMDNGKGYDINTVEMGNGLNSMKKRAKDINTTINYDSEIGKGTKISFTF